MSDIIDLNNIFQKINDKWDEINTVNSQYVDMCLPTYISKSTKKNILVLSGGGAKGIAFIGALRSLQNRGILSNITTYAGTSIGALILFLLNIGYTPDELYDFVKNFDFSKLKSFNITTLLETYGLDDGEKVKKFLIRFLMAKKLSPDITFEQLYEKTNKTLLVTSVNVNERHIEYFSHTTHPTMSIVQAIRMTTSIPFIFKPVTFNGNTYIDGGCIDNFPYRLFNDVIDNVIGIYITEPPCKTQHTNTIESYAINVMYSIIYGFAEFIGTDTEHDIIKIEIGDVTMVSFDLALKEKRRLHDIGYEALNTYNFK